MFTVKDLKELLETFPDDVVIGTTGHFGEAYLINKSNFCLTDSYLEEWYPNKKRTPITLLKIDCPDIGPEPE